MQPIGLRVTCGGPTKQWKILSLGRCNGKSTMNVGAGIRPNHLICDKPANTLRGRLEQTYRTKLSNQPKFPKNAFHTQLKQSQVFGPEFLESDHRLALSTVTQTRHENKRCAKCWAPHLLKRLAPQVWMICPYSRSLDHTHKSTSLKNVFS